MSLAISGDVEEMDGTEKSTLKVFKNITLVHESSMVMLEVSSKRPFMKLPVLCLLLIRRVSLCVRLQWIANPLNDMYADAVTTVVLEVQSNPKAQKGQSVNVGVQRALLQPACLPVLNSSDLLASPVMECQTTVMDMDVFQTRLGVMLQ